MAEEPTTSSESPTLLRWEFNALLLESILAGAGLFALLSWAGRAFLAPVHPWAVAAAYGVGFLLLMLALYPILNVHQRSVHGRRIGFGKILAWSALGSAVGALLFAVWH
ncbi:MAG TPA: hypothetical protein VNJ70_14045 [Thermoanaerobaculia bacterium]|nr:hypothetical protein [Thermoanaerobaculia bacterium]